MFSSTFGSSGSVRPQGSWLSSLSASTSTDTSSSTGRKMPLRGMTLPVPSNSKESHESGLNDSDSITGPQPIAAVASRLGVLGWFGSSSSIDTGVGVVAERPVGDDSKTQVEERPIGDESKTQVEEITVERSEPVCLVLDLKEEALLEREQQVESREKELEERKLGIDQRERELDNRSRELVDVEKKGEEVERREKELEVRRGEFEEVMRRKLEEVEGREKELEERRGEFEEERKRWIEERNISTENPAIVSLSAPEMSEWKNAMETLKKEMSLELSTERKKAEERELALETRVMKKVTDILALDKDQQSSGWKKRWDISLGKPLTRKSTSSTASDFGI